MNFWQQWLDDPESVRLAVYELLSLYSSEELNRLQHNTEQLDEQQLGAFFFIHNRMSFTGMPNRSLKMPYLRYDGEYITRPNDKNGNRKVFVDYDFWQSKPLSTLNIECADFESVFWIHQHQFTYIDPPYFGNEKGYGGSRENGFNHEKLRELLASRGKWDLSYNGHPEAHRLYEGYHIQPIKRGSDGRIELLILSPDIVERQLTLF